jgi:hypothetical protein
MGGRGGGKIIDLRCKKLQKFVGGEAQNCVGEL